VPLIATSRRSRDGWRAANCNPTIAPYEQPTNASSAAMPSASSTCAIASAWSAGSIGASSVPSAPSQSIASKPWRTGSSARPFPAWPCHQPGCGNASLAATWRPAEIPPATSSTGNVGSPSHS